jgi:hypothetical protein
VRACVRACVRALKGLLAIVLASLCNTAASRDKTLFTLANLEKLRMLQAPPPRTQSTAASVHGGRRLQRHAEPLTTVPPGIACRRSRSRCAPVPVQT